MLSRRARLLSLSALLLLSPLLASGPRAAVEEPANARVVVKYKALGSLMRAARAEAARGPQGAAWLSTRHRLALTDGRIVDGRTQVLLASGISSSALAARLAADEEVEYAVPDQRRRALALPNDPLLQAGAGISPAAGQWYLRAPDATFTSAINAVGAWNLTTGSAAVVVAVLDTGVQAGHPDLANKLHAGYDFVSDATEAGDGDGRDSNPTDVGDWAAANACGPGEPATESSWHGTVTAGLVGAQTNNGIGMASVGHDVMVLPVRVLGKCGGWDSDIVAAMLWSAGLSSNPVTNPRPARVLNLSLGSQGSCSAFYRDAFSQLTAAGVVVVAAAGNDAGLAVATPANCPGAIAVAGLRHAGTKVGFSSLGPEVAIAGPAGNCVSESTCLYPILSTSNAGTRAPAGHIYTDSANASVGTSFTSPLVAGTVGLMLSANPALTPTQVRTLLQGSARPFPTTAAAGVPMCRAPSAVEQDECICTTSTCGAGMLDAAGAVAAAAAGSLPQVSIAGGGSTWMAGTQLTLDGRGSSVASGRTVASYAWTITAGSGLAQIVGSSTGPTVVLAASGAGNVSVQLTVTDSAGISASHSVTLAVTAPAAPVVSLLASAQTVPAGGTVSFDGSASSVAEGLTITAYRWSLASGSTELVGFSTLLTGPTATVATNGSGSGSFTVRLTVTDSLGRQSSATATVTVTAVTPLASMSASATSVAAGSTVSFDSSGSTAPQGRSIASRAWEITSGSGVASISGAANGPTVTVATSAAGSFTIRLTVTDSAGAQDSRSSTVTVTAANPGGGGGGGGGSTGGGGGGATGPAALLGLGLAVLALARRRR